MAKLGYQINRNTRIPPTQPRNTQFTQRKKPDQIQIPKETTELRQIRHKALKRLYQKKPDEEQNLPLPRGDSSYAQAKRAEYVTRDLKLAKKLYLRCITEGERTESAVKDLASIYHQEGKTDKALNLLLQNRQVFLDQHKFKNLVYNLKKQKQPTGNALNKVVKLSPLSAKDTEFSVMNFFANTSRILDIQVKHCGSSHFALVFFPSHSAARKTLESFVRWNKYKIEWASGETRENQMESMWSMPLDEAYSPVQESPASEIEAEQLLGKDLVIALSTALDSIHSSYLSQLIY